MKLCNIAVLSFAIAHYSNSQAQLVEPDTCETTPPRITSHGTITKTDCGTAKKGYRQTINVDGVPVLTDTYLSREDFDEKYTKWIFRGATSPRALDKKYKSTLSMATSTVPSSLVRSTTAATQNFALAALPPDSDCH